MVYPSNHDFRGYEPGRVCYRPYAGNNATVRTLLELLDVETVGRKNFSDFHLKAHDHEVIIEGKNATNAACPHQSK